MSESTNIPTGDAVNVVAFERPITNGPSGANRVFVQAADAGAVQVDYAAGLDAAGPEQLLSQAQYEAMREQLARDGQADLPAYREIHPPPGKRAAGGTTTRPNGNTVGRVVGETPAGGKSARSSNPPVETETPAEDEEGDKVLDNIQTTLDVASMIPGLGAVAGVANAGISLSRGDFLGAGLNLAAAIPFAGWLGTAAKASRRAAKIASAAEKAAAKKAAKEAAEKAAKEAAEKAAKKSKGGAKVKAKTLPKKKPHCFDPRNAKFKKMSEAEQRKYLREYARQLKRQETAINNMTAKQFAEARAKFEAAKKASLGSKGRNPQAKKDQEAYRRERARTIRERIYKSKRRKGMDGSTTKADTTTKTDAIMEDLAALHEPDMVAGGWIKSKPSGLGSREVNSAIGGSWSKKGRVTTLEKAAEAAVKEGNEQSKMNVELTICPPGTKGK